MTFLAGLCALALIPARVFAQSSVPAFVEDGMLDCAAHKNKAWVPKEFRADGTLRFNFSLAVPEKDPGPYDYGTADRKFPTLIVVFWNADKTRGEMLAFDVGHSRRRLLLTIDNGGDVAYSRRGSLSLDTILWGEWTRTYYELHIKKLKAAPVETVQISDIKPTGTICDSFNDPYDQGDASAPATSP